MCVRQMRPPGGTFQFQTFIQASSPEIWPETISGGEEVLAGKWVACFWATSLKKNFGGVIAIISLRPGGWMQQSAEPNVLSFRSEAPEVLGSETTRVHHTSRRCGCGIHRGGGARRVFPRRAAGRGAGLPRASDHAGGAVSRRWRQRYTGARRCREDVPHARPASRGGEPRRGWRHHCDA